MSFFLLTDAGDPPIPANVKAGVAYGEDLTGTYTPDLPVVPHVLAGIQYGVGDPGGPLTGTLQVDYTPPAPLTGVMNFRVVTQALIDTLGASAAGKFIVIGYRKQVKDAEETRNNKRSVQVFYSDGNFPKSKGRQIGATQHLPEFTIELSVSTAARGNLAAIENPGATTQQIADAMSSFQDASYLAGVAFDELLEMIYQILMDARTFDLGLPKGVMSSRWVESMHKDGAQSTGSLVVQTGRIVYTCQTAEDVVGVTATPMTTGIGTVLDISGDDVERTGTHT
jgi:hypothetical protein